MKRVILLSLTILLISLAYSFAEVPCKINYQGRLIKDNVPVDGTKTMVFSIYGDAVGPPLLWTSGNVSVEVHNGLFRYVLGTDGGDLSSIFQTAGETLYLEVEVETEILTPREELSAYPYAINSHLLEGEAKEYFLNTSAETQTKQGNLNIMGNLGIGTTGPNDKLVISNGAVRFGRGNYKTGNVEIGRIFIDNSLTISGFGNDAWIFEKSDGNSTNPDSPIAFVTVGSDDVVNPRLVIQGSGNVGIGTTSPGEKLTVAGTIESTTGGVKFPDGTLQTTAGVFGSWTDKDSLNNTLVKDEVYKAGSDGFVCVRLVCTGMGNYDYGYIMGETDSANPPTTDVVYAGYMQYGTRIDHSGFNLPVKKDDYWKVSLAVYNGSCTKTVSILWLPIGSGQCVRQ